MPFRSDDADAAVGEVFATVLVLVSEMWILCSGMPKLRAATCEKIRKTKEKKRNQLLELKENTFLSMGIQRSAGASYLIHQNDVCSPGPFLCVVLVPFLFHHE